MNVGRCVLLLPLGRACVRYWLGLTKIHHIVLIIFLNIVAASDISCRGCHGVALGGGIVEFAKLVVILSCTRRTPSRNIYNLAWLPVLGCLPTHSLIIHRWRQEDTLLSIWKVLEFLCGVNNAAMIQLLHVRWTAGLVGRLHFNRRIYFTFEFGSTAKIAHGAAAKLATGWWDPILILLIIIFVMLQIILHATNTDLFHSVALSALETLVVVLAFALD